MRCSTSPIPRRASRRPRCSTSRAQQRTEVAIVRLASLLGISAIVIAVMILIVVAGVDVGSLFRSLPVT